MRAVLWITRPYNKHYGSRLVAGDSHPGLGGCFEHHKSEGHDDAALFPFALEGVETQFR
jgi:hypothetical protein